MEKFGFTRAVAIQQPYEDIERAFLIWDLDNKHDKLKKY
jgi:hypothetical protein